MVQKTLCYVQSGAQEVCLSCSPRGHCWFLDDGLFWHLWCKSGTGQSSFPHSTNSLKAGQVERHSIYDVQMGMSHDTTGLKRERLWDIDAFASVSAIIFPDPGLRMNFYQTLSFYTWQDWGPEMVELPKVHTWTRSGASCNAAQFPLAVSILTHCQLHVAEKGW